MVGSQAVPEIPPRCSEQTIKRDSFVVKIYFKVYASFASWNSGVHWFVEKFEVEDPTVIYARYTGSTQASMQEARAQELGIPGSHAAS